MAKFIHYDKKTGEVLGSYDDTIHLTIPSPNIEVTKEELTDILKNRREYSVNVIEKCIERKLNPSAVEVVSMTKEQALQEVDSYAEKIRLKYLTPLPGQAQAYQEKSEEAADFIAAGSPQNIDNYPWIQAETEATGKSPEEVANTILQKRSEWIIKGAQIEKERLYAKRLLKSSNDDETIKIVSDAKQQLDKI